MKHLWNKRRLAVLGAVAAVAGVTLWIVLPAVASNAGDYVGPASTTATVLPKDVAVGGNGNCSNLFPGLSGVSEYDNNNPKSGSYSAGNGVTFSLTLSKGQDRDKYLDFSATGAVVLGVGINGGSESTAYDYTNKDTYQTASKYKGSVTADTGLHAPAQSWTGSGTLGDPEQPSSLYSISHLTICYTVSSFIEGTVYKDNDQTGTYSSSSTDTLVPNTWKVRLYGNGSLITDQTTNNGAYHFDLPVDGTTYSVCEVPGDAAPSGQAWVESQPNPSLPPGTTSCSQSDETANGYQFKPTSAAGESGKDFGNVLGYTCGSAPVGIDVYTVGTCKSGQLYVFNSGLTSLNNQQVPFVDYWVGDPSKAQIPVVELINFPDPFDPATGLPKYTKLLYADGGGFPVVFNDLTTMPYCTLDPRDPTDPSYPNTFTLKSPYDTSSSGVLPGTNTSCVISIRITAPAPGTSTGALQAYVYALGDSIRSIG